MFANNKRDNQIDTQEEFMNEVEESMEDILSIINEYHYSLTENAVGKLVSGLHDYELKEILRKLYQVAPNDLRDFSVELEKKNSNIRDLILEIATKGKISRKFLDPKLFSILTREIFQNDPEEIVELKKLEVSLNLLGLKFRIQKLILEEYFKKHDNIPFDLNFYDVNKSKKEIELIEKEKLAKQTRMKSDDYVIEYRLGVERKYEIEQLIFLAKKTISYLRKDKIYNAIEDIDKDIRKRIEKNKDSISVIFDDFSFDDDLPFSFHQVKLKGSNYNFAFFGDGAFENDYFELPKINNEKPVLILLHGMFVNWACWKWFIRLLKDKYQIIVPDMNGYGESSELVKFHNFDNFADYIRNFIKVLGVKDYFIAGHSAGGFTLQQLLQQESIQPKKAMLVASAPYIKVGFVAEQLVNLSKNSRFKKLLADFIVMAPKKIMLNINYKNKYYPKESKRNALNKVSLRTVAETIHHLILEYNISDKKIYSKTDILIISPENDILIDQKLTEKLNEVFIDSKLVKIPGAPHLKVLKILPEHYPETILDFFK